MKQISEFIQFLNRLENVGIHYDLDKTSRENLIVMVAVPGERWEIEIQTDGTVDIEVFKSDGHINDSSEIEELFKEFKN